jgi:hypothetical protein
MSSLIDDGALRRPRQPFEPPLRSAYAQDSSVADVCAVLDADGAVVLENFVDEATLT